MHRPTVTRSIHLDAPVERIWSALGDPDGLAGWLGSAPSTDHPDGGPLREGAALDLDVDGTTRRLVVTAVVEGRRVGFVWWDLDRPADASTVDLVVEHTEHGATVTVTETIDPGARALAGAGRASLSAATVDLSSRWDRRLGALLGEVVDPHLLAV